MCVCMCVCARASVSVWLAAGGWHIRENLWQASGGRRRKGCRDPGAAKEKGEQENKVKHSPCEACALEKQKSKKERTRGNFLFLRALVHARRDEAALRKMHMTVQGA